MFEIEFKFRVKDKEKIDNELKKLNCKFSELHQCDHIYVRTGINDFNIYLYVLLCLISTILLACIFKPIVDILWKKISR